jgi:hypothetical protein
MPPDHVPTKEWPMAGQPPDNNNIKAPGDSPKRKRPAEFAPAGRRGDDSITRNLKRVYEQVAAEPVPPDLMKLLDQLGDRRNGGDDDV